MAVKLDWNKINNSSPSDSKKSTDSENQSGFKPLRFVTLGRRSMGKTVTIRPVGSVVGFFKATVKDSNGRIKNIYVDMDDQGGDSLVKKHPLYLSHNVKFNIRYAINVINRSNNQLEILEGGPSIFSELQKFYEYVGKEPGGPHGANFSIYVSGKKGKDYYQVTCKEKTPFTKEEIEYIRNEKLYKLDQIFQQTPDDKWKAWVGEASEGEDLNVDFSKSVSKDNSNQQQKTSNNSSVAEPSNDDDNFLDNLEESGDVSEEDALDLEEADTMEW